MNGFERKVASVWQKAGCPSLLVCVSGGADSVALLLSLREAVGADAPLKVLHCNFHLRGEESERDKDFVEALCRRLEVPLEIKDFDVDSYRMEHSCSMETACRELRYDWFRRCAAVMESPVRIATGHHADDNAETLFLNLFRGSGVNGLKGMVADTGEILRPMLAFSQEEILEYLKEKGENYVDDSSNFQSDFRRNFLRNELIPLAESRWPGLRKALANSQEILRDEAAVLDAVTASILTSPLRLELNDLRKVSAPSVVIYRFIAPHGGNSEQARSMAAAMAKYPFQSGKIWKMPDGVRISLERDSFRALPSEKEIEGCPPVFCWGKTEFSAEERTRMMSDRSNNTAWLPRPPENYTLRRAKPADRVKPLGMKGSKLLSDIMKDAHMTLAEKENQWVLTDSDTEEIIWVPGLRRSRLDLVPPDAADCYKVVFSGGGGYELYDTDMLSAF